jgi:putative chitinase
MNIDQLILCMPGLSQGRAAKYIDAINATLTAYNISTPLRICHFLSQLGHESGSLRYTEEIASGAAYDTGRLAAALGNTPQADGDGQSYKGRGFIQLTGKTNYRKYSKQSGIDFIANPKLLAEVPYCADSAGWYWATHGLNELADQDNVRAITKKINGGYNGLADRMSRLTVCKRVFGI